MHPPASLAAGNRPPSAAHVKVALGPNGSQIDAVSTGDGQAQLLLGTGAFPASAGQTAVAVDVEPLDPAGLAPPPQGLVLAGNAYKLTARYLPSGRPIGAVTGQSNLSLVYPLLTIHISGPASHVLLASPDGKRWTHRLGNDTPGTQQVAAGIDRLGFYVVAVPPAPPVPAGRRSSTLVLIGIGVGAVVLLAALLLWRRADAGARQGPDRRPRRPRPGSRARGPADGQRRPGTGGTRPRPPR